MIRPLFFASIFSFVSLIGNAPFESCPPAYISSLYHSLDPLSIVQNLSFYELYPQSQEGKLALKKAWSLLCEDESLQENCPLTLPKLDLEAIIALVTKEPSDKPTDLSEAQLQIMDRIGSKLANRSLQGSKAWSQKEVLALPSEEVDLGRALLICQFEEDPDYKKKILQYEASLDLMALQIKKRLKQNNTTLCIIAKSLRNLLLLRIVNPSKIIYVIL